MGKKHSETRATAFLRKHGVEFTEHPYQYVDRGGAAESARQLEVDLHHVVKTLIMQDESRRPLVVLMHGDCSVSTKNLARSIGCKSVQACEPADAERHSGYQVGGTSPFGLRKALPVYVERSILSLARIYINGGRRGMLVSLTPDVLVTWAKATAVDCALTD